MHALLEFLDKHQIAYDRHDHPAVYTVEEAERLVPDLPGVKTKNLFLRNKKGTRHFLVIVPAAKKVDIRGLSDALASGRLSFGSAERLMKYLGIEAGAVSPLAIFNDSGLHVNVVMDAEIFDAEQFQFHPLTNTSTLVISQQSLQRFADLTRHKIQKLVVPSAGPSA
jgi:Ala-tRNA(Pro) deacylase